MAEMSNHPEMATVERSHGISPIWLIPLFALLIGLWLVYQQWRDQGPEITIQFESAAGLEVGKTKIKTRDVEVGTVSQIRLNEDLNGVIVRGQMNKNTSKLLKTNSKFWVVKPRVDHSGVSGLNTLLSGAYIELSPGTAEDAERAFIGLEAPPVTPAGTPGLHITLNSNDRFEYAVGDKVIYKGLAVGRFEDVYFNEEERVVYYNVFIEAPYHKLLSSNTRFWNASGIHVALSANGVSLNTESLQALLSNSVTFGVPKGEAIGEQVTERSDFTIYKNYSAATQPIYNYTAEYVVLIRDTVRGLSVGAPVEYRGIPVGHVKAINFVPPKQGSIIENSYQIPVLIAIEPGKIGFPDDEASLETVISQNEVWIKRGLQAKLQTGNLLTGQLFVELQHYEDRSIDVIPVFEGYQVIPSTLDSFSQITQKASDLLDKINALPMEAIATNANTVLGDLATTVNSLEQLSTQMTAIVTDVNQQGTVEELNNTVSSLNQLLNTYSEGSTSHAQLMDTLHSLNTRLQDLEPLLLQLNQKPNGLIFTSGHRADKQPKAKRDNTQ